MDWENKRIEEKLGRLAEPPKRRGHLMSLEGGRIDECRTVGGTLLGRLVGLLKRKAPGLRIVEKRH